MTEITTSYITKQGRTARPELETAISEITAKAQAQLTLPGTIELVILLDVKAADTQENGVYLHKGAYKIVNGKYQGRTNTPTIQIACIDRTVRQIRWTLAHEFGHAEHFATQPESGSWETSRQERYANRTAERICHYGVYVPAE